MVLDEVSNADGLGNEPTPQSDSDPFADHAPSDVNISIDITTLPKPVPIVGFLVGYGTQARARKLHEGFAQAQSLMGRPLQQKEAEAIGQHYSQIMATSSWGDTVGIAVGGLQCYKSAHYYRFPFWSPNLEKFNPNQLGPFRGAQARIAWHSLRVVPYLAMGAFVGDLIFRNFGTVNAAIAMRKDERLKGFNQALETALQKKLEDVGQRRQRNRQFPEAQQREREGLSRPTSRPSKDDYDDMSPTSGAFTDTYGDRADTGIMTDGQLRNEAQRRGEAVYESGYRGPPQQAPMHNTARNPPPTQRQDDRTDSFDLTGGTDTSASNTQAPLPQWARNRNAGQSTGGGSSWDRLRQQAQGDAGSQSQQGQQPRQGSSTFGDSFSFSSSDEERQLAKSEAQKEFDRRVERERQGQDFNDSAKRW